MTEALATTPEICENKQALLDEIISTHRNRQGALMVILNEIQKQHDGKLFREFLCCRVNCVNRKDSDCREDEACSDGNHGKKIDPFLVQDTLYCKPE